MVKCTERKRKRRKRAEKQKWYKDKKEKAYDIKFKAQMLVGLVVFLSVIFCAAKALIIMVACGTCNSAEVSTPLKIVSYGLGVSAGIEMAYMLFTPGPDEAVEPVILSLASAFLYTLSVNSISPSDLAILIIALTISMAGLFHVKVKYIDK